MQSSTPTVILSANQSDKIMMIKHLRCLTKLLGKLGVKCLVRENSMWLHQQRYNKPHYDAKGYQWPRYTYGFGLKEAKDFVEIYLDRKTKQVCSVS